jgi:hypothetical protein
MSAMHADLSEVFDREVLMSAASREARLDDYGDDQFVEPLTRFLDGLVTEANLNPDAIAEQIQVWPFLDVQRMLVNRLRFQDDLKRYPEILDSELSNPLVIVGLPRTGSTKLQRIMSQDPAVRRMPFWLTLNPAPLPGWKRGFPDARIDLARQVVARQSSAQQARHSFEAEGVDEDVLFFHMTFESFHNGYAFHLPSYREWVKTRPMQNTYGYARRILQYLQWQDNSPTDRPWVLKNTSHLGYLDTLFDMFPDATFVHTHREPSIAVASACMNREIRWSLEMKAVDLSELGNGFSLPGPER